ncbi:MAG TPA: nitrogen regulation protein NR(II) [Usitatibacteraceae bacterium]|nr:nitrogen regulation protein NR(II) [Usitatibacteraceae bacterium]
MSLPSVSSYAGLDLLSTAVLLVSRAFNVIHANSAAENLLGVSTRGAAGQALARLFPPALAGNAALFAMLEKAHASGAGVGESELSLETIAQQALHVACSATPADDERLVLEFHALDQQIRIAREEKRLERQELNRELMRNLAHEIKNPLGGIRGAAQLLAGELRGLPREGELAEYTSVIVEEADRLQRLMDRLLAPHRSPKLARLNIHEVMERVRTLILAEFPAGIVLIRDYDTSLPDIIGDKESLIQALLNIARNAAQAMHGRGTIRLVTRIARQVTLARKRYRHALQVEIIDSGPGIPDALAERIFFPLVSGREGGTGLGLSIAQNFVSQHQGTIEFASSKNGTCFTVLLPVRESLNLLNG